jgi:hypothetical protein
MEIQIYLIGQGGHFADKHARAWFREPPSELVAVRISSVRTSHVHSTDGQHRHSIRTVLTKVHLNRIAYLAIMVQLEEVADEDFFATQPGPKEDEDDWDTDDGTLG